MISSRTLLKSLLLLVLIFGLQPGCGSRPEAPPAPAAVNDASTSDGSAVTPTDWCGGHGVPESVCTRCNPKLIPDFQARGDWCQEHGLPESQCTICHPDLIEKFRKMAPLSSRSGSREELPALKPFDGVRVRLATPETAAKAGILTALVETDTVALSVAVPVRLAFDGTRAARISSPLAGVVREVQVVAGARVRHGQQVLVLASPELAEASARLRDAEAALALARPTVEREEHLVALRVSAQKDLLEAKRQFSAAEASVASARGVLSSLGVGPGAAGDAGERLILRAPGAGVVTHVDAVVGQAVTPGEGLVEVHDPSRLWAELDLHERDASRVREGGSISLVFDALPGETFAGRLIWLSPEVNPTTRTVRARGEVENPEGSLRAGMFGRAQVPIESHRNVVVSDEVIQETPEGPVAFVQVEPQVYEPRPVRLGLRTRGVVEVLAGILPGERVVTQGSFLLKTEIMKGSLGAGCCDAVEK